MEVDPIWGSISNSAAHPSREVVFLLFCAVWEATAGALCLFFSSSVKKKKKDIDILEWVLQKVSKMIKEDGLRKH